MMSVAEHAGSPADAAMKVILPVMGVVFLSFLVIGMALPVLPLHVHEVLGFGPTVVGIVAGGQFVAALLSRLWAGRLADSAGPRRAVVVGLCASIAGGLLYLVSLGLMKHPVASVAVLFAGRTLIGGAESLIITGGIAWGLGLGPGGRSAKTISWIGMSMFAAMAAGAPVGSVLFGRSGFQGIAIATVVVSIAGLLIACMVRPFVPEAGPRAAIGEVLRAVALPGLGFALSGLTFGAVTSFLTLYFAVQGWPFGAVAFTSFATALVLARVFMGHLPDMMGGARTAVYCLALQAAGLCLIGLAGSAPVAIVGAALSGAGFSLVFPGLGLEAVRRAPPQARGMAMGVYNTFLDATLGFGSPALGFLAAHAGLGSVFIASAGAAALAIPVATYLSRASR